MHLTVLYALWVAAVLLTTACAVRGAGAGWATAALVLASCAIAYRWTDDDDDDRPGREPTI